MSEPIGAYAAKTHFSQLLGRVEQGESLIVTRNGRPLAMLVPAGRPAQASAAEAVA